MRVCMRVRACAFIRNFPSQSPLNIHWSDQFVLKLLAARGAIDRPAILPNEGSTGAYWLALFVYTSFPLRRLTTASGSAVGDNRLESVGAV